MLAERENSLNKKIFYAIFVQGCLHTFSEKKIKKKKLERELKHQGYSFFYALNNSVYEN